LSATAQAEGKLDRGNASQKSFLVLFYKKEQRPSF
jgi:hypothetical protein